jgi:hypothetical protein
MAAWLHGVPAVPTFAKEYILGPLTEVAQNQMALGGLVGTVAALLAAGTWHNRRPGAMRSALLAGTLVLPGFYALRFFLAGRGHDGTEFQEAQAALGLSYAGHAMDWLFVGLFVVAGMFWFWRTRPPLNLRLAVRLAAGAVVGLAVLVFVQVGNNAMFDRFFVQ